MLDGWEVYSLSPLETPNAETMEYLVANKNNFDL